MMWEGINQRKFPRISYKCLIKVSREDRDEVVDTYTENIGAGGICVVLNRDLGLFTPVQIEVFLEEGKEPIACGGTIVWVVKKHPANALENVTFDTGIEFTDIVPAERDRISGLVTRLLSA